MFTMFCNWRRRSVIYLHQHEWKHAANMGDTSVEKGNVICHTCCLQAIRWVLIRRALMNGNNNNRNSGFSFRLSNTGHHVDGLYSWWSCYWSCMSTRISLYTCLINGRNTHKAHIFWFWFCTRCSKTMSAVWNNQSNPSILFRPK